jgi:hypothetical protein
LLIYCGDQVEDFFKLTPWRKEKQFTAGRVRMGLQVILSNVRVRDWWNPTYRIFKPPGQDQTQSMSTKEPQWQAYIMSKNITGPAQQSRPEQ